MKTVQQPQHPGNLKVNRKHFHKKIFTVTIHTVYMNEIVYRVWCVWCMAKNGKMLTVNRTRTEQDLEPTTSITFKTRLISCAYGDFFYLSRKENYNETPVCLETYNTHSHRSDQLSTPGNMCSRFQADKAS